MRTVFAHKCYAESVFLCFGLILFLPAKVVNARQCGEAITRRIFLLKFPRPYHMHGLMLQLSGFACAGPHDLQALYINYYFGDTMGTQGKWAR